jgi:hypothetical protein
LHTREQQGLTATCEPFGTSLQPHTSRLTSASLHRLVGKTSLIPSLTDTLATLLSNARPCNTLPTPTPLAAVYGAAVQASYFGEQGCSSGDWVGAFELTPLSLGASASFRPYLETDADLSCCYEGIETSNGLLHRLIPRNYILPRRVVANVSSKDGRELMICLLIFL